MQQRRYLSPIHASPCASPSRSHRISVQALTDASVLPKLLHFPDVPSSMPTVNSHLPPNLSHSLPHIKQQTLPALSFPLIRPLAPPPLPRHPVPSFSSPPSPPLPSPLPQPSLPSAHQLASQLSFPPASHCFVPPPPLCSDDRSVQSAPSPHQFRWRSSSYQSLNLHAAPYTIAKRARKRGTVKRLWTPQEDDRLRCLARLRPENWNVIAESLPGRTGKQCRERWLNHLQDGMCLQTHSTAFNLLRTPTSN
eukprot:TRINITY_DN3098_c0_g1_i1.p1 TRINITY_DN3098_c0_g1~~TRINITY_DN3098_c0_g1_i1.p1  ORF type:complete len:282 (-),score=33.12 TRINITY_DN3098_c0_g1_i1:1205-1957(-)